MNSSAKAILTVLCIPAVAVFYLGLIWWLGFQVLSFIGLREGIAQFASGAFALISAAFVSAVLLVWAEENVK